ncbi:MAG: YkvA family protein [Pirellulales bacterium]
MDRPDDEFSQQYSDPKFWDKLLGYAKAAGSEVVERALQLYYGAQDPHTPAWAKAVIIGALGYFITPTDAVPDLIPAVGYSDDLGVLVLALATVALYITPAVREQARKKLKEWFG